MAYVEERERSPWPWVVVALGLLAFVAAVIFLTRPAELAPPQNGATTTTQPPAGNGTGQPSQRTTINVDGSKGEGGGQPSGNTTVIQRNEGANEGGTATGGNQPAANQPASGTPSGNAPTTAPAPSTTTPPGAGTGNQAPANQPAGTTTGGQPAGSTEAPQTTPVAVQMGEWFVRLNPATVPSGPTRFSVRNVGKVTHGFALEGQGIDQQGDTLDPGERDTVTVNLTPGDYTAYCFVGNHRERGMETTLHVRQR